MLHRISGHGGPRLQEPCSCARAHPVRNACATHACAFMRSRSKNKFAAPILPSPNVGEGAGGEGTHPTSSRRPAHGHPTASPGAPHGLSTACPRAVPEPVSPPESGETPSHSFNQPKAASVRYSVTPILRYPLASSWRLGGENVPPRTVRAATPAPHPKSKIGDPKCAALLPKPVRAARESSANCSSPPPRRGPG
jgi:hypothetical protein